MPTLTIGRGSTNGQRPKEVRRGGNYAGTPGSKTESRSLPFGVFFALTLSRILFVPEINLPERLSERVQANQIASISLMAALLMLLVPPLIELLLGRSKSIWRKAAAFVFWALAWCMPRNAMFLPLVSSWGW